MPTIMMSDGTTWEVVEPSTVPGAIRRIEKAHEEKQMARLKDADRGREPSSRCQRLLESMKADIDDTELLALREQAAKAIPMEMEATRLAEALNVVDPENQLLQSDVWQRHFQRRQALIDEGHGSSPQSVGFGE